MFIRILFDDLRTEEYKYVWRLSFIGSIKKECLVIQFHDRDDDKAIPLRDILCWEVTAL